MWDVGEAWAWSGYDYGTGAHVEIESGNLVRPGQDIEIYDYSDGSYKEVEVQNIINYEIARTKGFEKIKGKNFVFPNDKNFTYGQMVQSLKIS